MRQCPRIQAFHSFAEKPAADETQKTVSRLVVQSLSLIHIYDSDTDLTRVQRHSDGIVEILQSSDDVALASDIAKLVVPQNCFFHTLFMDFGRPINMKWAKVNGLHAVMASDVKIEMLLKYASEPM